MVKIKYLGDITPCRIKIRDVRINRWDKGEIKDLDEKTGRKLLKDNKNFELVSGQVKEVRETYTKDDIYAKNKSWQVDKLKEFGLDDDEIDEFKYEKQRVNKILEKQRNL